MKKCKVNSFFKKTILLFTISIFFFSCKKNVSTEKQINFYHWKSKATVDEVIEKSLKTANTKTIFLHYFDVIKNPKKSWKNKEESYPTYLIKEIDESYKKYNIVPVVFITNQAMADSSVEQIAKNIKDLVDEISKHHFGKKLPSLQLDCDWTQTTKSAYFKLIETLKKDFEISVTIRLHQIKFPDKTGIPPVDKGALMLYNIGDLKEESQNSILTVDIVHQYINSSTNYPLTLDLALPVFSQTVIKNTKNEVRLLNKVDTEMLKKQTDYFKPINEHLFEVIADTLYEGFYLLKGFKLKIEQPTIEEIIASTKIIHNSKLNIENTILYHLDSRTLSNIDLEKLCDSL